MDSMIAGKVGAIAIFLNAGEHVGVQHYTERLSRRKSSRAAQEFAAANDSVFLGLNDDRSGATSSES
jgi:hypothetical protein